jgi:signal transduction histidine kinase
MKRWLLGLLVIVPMVLGGLVAAAFWFAWLPNPVAYVRADLGTIAIMFGLLLTFVLSVEWIRGLRGYYRRQDFVAKLQSDSVSERHEFLRRLDHELKNPVMAMRAGLANLNGTTLEPSQREIVDSVEDQTLRLSRFLADLRKLAELKTRPLDSAPVDMSDLLQEVISVAEERPEAEGWKLTLSLPKVPWPLPPVAGDRDLLFLLFHNLIDNALKFTQPGSTIELRAFEDRSKVVVEVADTGPGIPEEEAPLVWDELYRGEGARGVPGSGIGLALVRAITERHNGEIFFRSRVGQGTVFSLRLPAYQK